MIQKLFTVYDEKAEAYLPPFFVPTFGIATRAFQECVNSDSHQFGKHPADYSLFYLGEFTDHDGEFQLIDRKLIGNGLEYVQPEIPTSEPKTIDQGEGKESEKPT